MSASPSIVREQQEQHPPLIPEKLELELELDFDFDNADEAEIKGAWFELFYRVF